MEQEVSTEPPVQLANRGPVGPQTDPDSDEWCTPKSLADELGPYDLDPCSNERSHIRANYAVTNYPTTDGLTLNWLWMARRIFINPPYSNVGPWVEKAVDFIKRKGFEGYWRGEGRVKGSVDLLVKADPTTKWWAAAIAGGAVPLFFKKRIKFERPNKKPLTANFPSALLCFRGDGYGGTTKVFRRPLSDAIVWDGDTGPRCREPVRDLGGLSVWCKNDCDRTPEPIAVEKTEPLFHGWSGAFGSVKKDTALAFPSSVGRPCPCGRGDVVMYDRGQQMWRCLDSAGICTYHFH